MSRVPVAVPITAFVVGAMFAIFGIARPAFVWNTGKVQQGRAWIGDTGLTIFFVVFGLALIAVGIVAATRRPSP